MEHSTRKLGTTFTWIGWIGGFILLVLLFQRIVDHQNNPNQSVNTLNTSAYQEIVLQQNRWGHYVLTGEINHHPVTFLVDTGATTTSIPMRLAKKLGLEKGYAYTVSTANGNTTAYRTQIDSLKLGNMEFQFITASLNPGLDGDEALLGMNVLKQLEIIQRDELLILRSFQ